MQGFFKFDEKGRVSYRLHVADFNSTTETLYAIPEGFTADSDYALIDGVVVYVGPPPTPNHEWNGAAYVLNTSKLTGMVKAHRAILLLNSDWTQLPDVPLSTQASWQLYRQALRDITEQAGYPEDIVWPATPE